MITRWVLAPAAVLLAAALLAGCGTTHAAQTAPGGPPVGLSLATAAGYPGGSWAVLVMGGSRAAHNNFWQVFVRPARKTAWRLATPPGVASNGGISVAATGGQSLVAALRPSQKLAFSPLARSADNGTRWVQDGLLDAPLAAGVSALAAAPGGGLIALTRSGGVEVSAYPGATWARRASAQALAAAAVTRNCRLTRLTAAGYSPSGTVLLAGACAKPGQVGIFAAQGGGWAAVGPPLPATLAGRPVTVLQLARAGQEDAALLLAGRGRTASLIGAWSSRDGRQWRLSGPYSLGTARPRSAAWAGNKLGVLLAGGRAVSVSGPGAPWRALPALPAGIPALPAGAATLAAAPSGGFQALTARGGRLSVWTLGSGTGTWSRSQAISVAIPYGSSG
jgi:hypothetical protein